MESNDTRPAIVVTSAITIASRGRSTKIDENMSLAADGLFDGASGDRHARPQSSHPADNDQLSAGEAVGNDNRAAYGWPNLDTLNCSLSAVDRKDIDTLLVRNQRRLRHDDPLLRLVALDAHLNELPVDEPVFRIWNRRAHRDRVGRPIDFNINEVDLARVWIHGSV